MLKRILVITLTGLFAANACAGSWLPSQSDYYYQIGGTSLFVPAVSSDETLKIGGTFESRLGFSCTGFNPVVTIANTFQDLKSTAVNIPNGIIEKLKGSVAGYPLYKLQQSMPDLYNVLQNTSASAQNDFTLGINDCHAVKNNLEAGQSPLDSMLSVSDSQGWLDAAKRAETSDVDVKQASKTIVKKRDEYGLPWIGREKGNAGGKFQRPIKVINDVVVAGYNILLNRTPLDNTTDASSFNTPMTREWKSPEIAAQWAVKVLGDINISASEKNTEDTHGAKAGIGLSALLQTCETSTTCTTNIAKALWMLVDKKWLLTDENLQKVSASNLMVTDEIILTIQRMPREEQMLSVSKLAEEIAVQNMLDKALMMRRILQAGLQVQEVQNLKPALNMIKFALKKLDDDIHSLAFENEVRRKMMTETLSVLMQIRNQELAKGIPGEDKEQTPVKNGAIYYKQSKQAR